MKFAFGNLNGFALKYLLRKNEMRAALPLRISIKGKFHPCTLVHFMM